MKRGESTREYGPSGPAQVTVTKNSLRIRFLESNVLYEIPRENCPNYASTGKFKVNLSEDTTKVLSLSPMDGGYLVKFVRFGRKDSVPAPKREQSPGRRKDGTMYPRDFLKFSATVEVVEGPAKGCSIICPFVYRDKGNGFANDGEGEVMLAGTNRDVQKLTDFLTAAGVFETRLPFSDNILPALQDVLQRHGEVFKVTVTDGWPVAYEAIPHKPTKKATPAKRKVTDATIIRMATRKPKKDKIPF